MTTHDNADDKSRDYLYDPSLAQMRAAVLVVYKGYEGDEAEFDREPEWRKVVFLAMGEEILRAAYAAACAERRNAE